MPLSKELQKKLSLARELNATCADVLIGLPPITAACEPPKSNPFKKAKSIPKDTESIYRDLESTFALGLASSKLVADLKGKVHATQPPLQAIHILDKAQEDRLAAQHREIHALLADNRHVVATHVALKQELDASHNKLVVDGNTTAQARAERDTAVREVLERSVKAEAWVHGK
ncbi:hypothetical protein KSP39_PZI014250 [Platanthera zijinensis]|uniref:Uncharacterized protein n=1 Tax=Platanthera zijinensis TaxID=2320716 RepID=A0AAP0G2P6_9ASPA